MKQQQQSVVSETWASKEAAKPETWSSKPKTRRKVGAIIRANPSRDDQVQLGIEPKVLARLSYPLRGVAGTN